MVYTKKIDSSKAIVAVAKYIYQNRPYHFTDENDVFTYFIDNSNARIINQNVNSKMNFAGAKFSFLKKYRNENTLEIQLGNELRKDFLNSEITLFNSLNQNIDFDKSVFVNDVNFQEVELKLLDSENRFIGITNIPLQEIQILYVKKYKIL